MSAEIRWARSWLGLLSLSTALAIIFIVLAITRVVSAHTARPRLIGTDVFYHNARRAPSFVLQNQNRRTMTVRSLRGHIVALTFLDSRCHQECPVAGRELASVQRHLGRHSPLVIAVISVDPSGDTPRSARTFMREAGLQGNWYWLFGTEHQLSRIWVEYGIEVRPTRKDILHTAAVYLIDRNGFVRVADGVPLLPWQLAESVRALGGW